MRTWPWRKEQQLHGSRRAKPCDHASVGTALQSIWPVAASQEGARGADKAQSLLLGRGGGTGRNYLHFRATSANGLSFGTDARREEQHHARHGEHHQQHQQHARWSHQLSLPCGAAARNPGAAALRGGVVANEIPQL